MFVSRWKALSAAVAVTVAVLGTGAGALLSQGPAKVQAPAPAPARAARDRDPNRQEVPSPVAGILLFVGTEVKPGEKVPAALLLKAKVGDQEKTYRRLRVGDRVEDGQLVAYVDDRPARAEVAIRQAGLDVAQANRRASQATRDEAQKRYDSLVKTKGRAPGAVSEEEVRAAKLTWDRYKEEEIARAAEVKRAEAQLKVARVLLEQHAIRGSVRGVVRAIYKRRGEAVKALEPVLLLEADGRPAPAPRKDADRIGVPAERDGKLLFLVTEIKPGEKVKADQIVPVERHLLALEVSPEEYARTRPEERVSLPGTAKKARLWKQSDELTPGRLRLVRVRVVYRKLKRGDEVEEGQLLGLLNPALALDELSVKLAKLEAAEAQRQTAVATKYEAQKRVDAIVKSRTNARTSVSDDEYRGAVLTYEKYRQEEEAKTAAVWQAQREVNQALTTLKMHEVRSPVPGVIRRFYRRAGEAVKNLESVLQIEETSAE